MKSQPKTVTLSIEIDENIYQCMQDFLNSNSQWNSKALLNASLSLFLLQNHKQIEPADYKACAQKYLHSVSSLPYQYSQN